FEDGMPDSDDFLSADEGPHPRPDSSDEFDEFYASADEDWDRNASDWGSIASASNYQSCNDGFNSAISYEFNAMFLASMFSQSSSDEERTSEERNSEVR
ncbi:hypothetical protein A2U01_0073137, partial [Trifolium medium]|nr:hypothetical protein [Trifolium medium]